MVLSIRKEKFIHVLKYIIMCPGKFKNNNIETSVWKYMLHFHSYYKAITSFSRARNICVITGRTRGLYRSFQLARMQIREKVQNGAFLGVSKSSW